MAQIAIYVTPRSAKSKIGSWRAGANGREVLEIRVAELPADGAANAAVVKLLAKALGISRSEVTITAGAGSRHKRIEIPFEIEEVRKRLGG